MQTRLASNNSASTLTLSSQGDITDDANSSLSVTNRATISGASVTLGDNAGDSLAFGQLNFDSTGLVAIREQGNMQLVGNNHASSALLETIATAGQPGDIDVDGATSVVNSLILKAGGDLDQTASLRGQGLGLQVNGDITLTADNDVTTLAARSAGSLQFNDIDDLTTGSVTVATSTITDIEVTGTNKSVRLTAMGPVTLADVRVDDGGLFVETPGQINVECYPRKPL